jgi:hypothetical protein
VPELDLLDSPDTTSSCEQRPISTTAPQALTFLNGAFTNEMAREFAARLEREAGRDPSTLIRRAFELAFCRPPRADELQTCVEFLTKQVEIVETEARADGEQARKSADVNAQRRALEAFCLVLLNANEFVYPS